MITHPKSQAALNQGDSSPAGVKLRLEALVSVAYTLEENEAALTVAVKQLLSTLEAVAFAFEGGRPQELAAALTLARNVLEKYAPAKDAAHAQAMSERFAEPFAGFPAG